MKIHWIAERDENLSRKYWLKTGCGIQGIHEGGNEFTVLDGVENRLECTAFPNDVTCKRCLPAKLRALAAQEDGDA